MEKDDYQNTKQFSENLKEIRKYFNGNISVMDVTQKITSQTGSDHFNVTSKIICSNTSEND